MRLHARATVQGDSAGRVSALIAPADLAKILIVSEITLKHWRAQRKGPDYVKCGKLIRYPADSVQAWIESQTRSNHDASEGTIREMAHPVLGRRSAILSTNRLGGHRTKQE